MDRTGPGNNVSTRSDALDELMEQLSTSGLEALLEHVRALAVVLDARGVTVGWNHAFDAVREPLPQANRLEEFLTPPAGTDFQQSLQKALQVNGSPVLMHLDIGSQAGRAEYRCELIPLSAERVLLVAEPVALADGEELEGVRAQLQEAKLALEIKQKELQAVLAQTEEVVHTDALTLLPNRKWIIADLQRQVTYSERYGSPLSVSMIDLDKFKDINDTYGHAAGDQVLRFIASEMRDGIRQPDEIGRYGGDEFLVILPNTTVNAAAEQANRLCQHIKSTPVVAGKEVISVSLSIGIAQYRPSGDDWHSLLERADQALYQAKNNGRGQWAILKG